MLICDPKLLQQLGIFANIVSYVLNDWDSNPYKDRFFPLSRPDCRTHTAYRMGAGISSPNGSAAGACSWPLIIQWWR